MKQVKIISQKTCRGGYAKCEGSFRYRFKYSANEIGQYEWAVNCNKNRFFWGVYNNGEQWI